MRHLAYRARDALGSKEVWLVASVMLLAACLRFCSHDHLPPGLYRDEALNGLDALRVLDGERPVYFEANNGREPLFIYLVAGFVALFGRSPGAIRFAAACLGTLTVPASYLMAKALFNRRIGLLTAILVATTFWTLNLSRVGFRAVSMPLFSSLTIWCLVRGIRMGRWGDWVAAGIFCGLGFYSYLAFRATIVIWAMAIAYLAWIRRPRVSWRHLGLFAATASVVVAPLLAYAAIHSEAFVQRAGQLSIWSPEIGGGNPWAALLRQIASSVLMFVYRGDFIPRHNLPLRPVFDPLMAAFFVAGVVWCMAHLRSRASCAFALGWTSIMLLPTMLAEGAPHFLRSAGVLPIALVFPAIGLDLGWRWLAQKWQVSYAWVVVCAALAVSGTWSGWDYFGRHVRSEATYFNFEAGATALSAEVNRFLGQGWQGQGVFVKERPGLPLAQAYIDRRLWDGWAALRFLVPTSSRVTVWASEAMPERDLRYPETLVVVWPYADYGSALDLLPVNSVISVREGSQERGDLEEEARLLYVSFSARPQSSGIPQNVGRRFEEGIALVGYEYAFASPTQLSLRLYWQADKPPQAKWTVFVHVRRGSEMNGQDDTPPARGYYPTDLWRAGDIIVDEHPITLSAPFDEASDAIWIGLYQYEAARRVQLLDDAGVPVSDHVILHLPFREPE